MAKHLTQVLRGTEKSGCSWSETLFQDAILKTASYKGYLILFFYFFIFIFLFLSISFYLFLFIYFPFVTILTPCPPFSQFTANYPISAMPSNSLTQPPKVMVVMVTVVMVVTIVVVVAVVVGEINKGEDTLRVPLVCVWSPKMVEFENRRGFNSRFCVREGGERGEGEGGRGGKREGAV